MHQDHEIRPLLPSDAPAYRALRLAALADSPEAFGAAVEEEQELSVEQFVERLTPSTDQAATLGLFVDGRMGGVVAVVRMPRLKTRHKAGIYGMYIAPELRGRGWGRRLLEEAIAAGRRMKGVDQLQLSVVVTQTAARTLYQAMGFVPYGLERRALRVGDRELDEEHMALDLG